MKPKPFSPLNHLTLPVAMFSRSAPGRFVFAAQAEDAGFAGAAHLTTRVTYEKLVDD
jgi:hypothetical protein